MTTSSSQAPVALIFPPLIESNFGNFFPSTAVLAAFLAQNDIPCVQEDLNEEFALHLLSDEMLARIGGGGVPGTPRGSAAAAVARWSATHRSELFDEDGRHWFSESRAGVGVGNSLIMEMLAKPFQLDPGPEVLGGVRTGTHPVDVFEEFFVSSGIVDRIPQDTALIGISVPTGPQLELSLLLAAMFKCRYPATPIVLGGPTFSLMTTDDLGTLLSCHPAVDCVVRFDGEFPLLELARRARGGAFSAQDVPGSSYLSDDGPRHQDPGPGPNINQLPPPAYPKEALARIGGTTLGITQARGCYWGKCDYCDFVELYDGSQPFRGRHPDGFVNEIQTLVNETGIRRYRFITESIPPAFARRMSQLLIDRDVKISWNSFAMVDRRFDKDLLQLMVDAGCEFLTIGLETTNTRILKLVHKSADRDENLRFLRESKDAGMKLTINLIPDLPSTTYGEAMATLHEISELADCIDRVNVFPFEATRSSNVGRHPERFGLIQSDRAPASGQAQFGLNHYGSFDPAMTAEERSEVYRAYRGFADKVSRRTLPRSLLVSLLWS